MTATQERSIAHGGALAAASAAFSLPRERWLDLSTGINPESWPVPELPQSVWQRLPDEDELEAVAAEYYACTETLPLAVPGSQWAIEHVPALLNPAGVAMPAVTYAEHPFAWRRAGHQLHFYRNWGELEALLESGVCRYLVVVNPGNPCGRVAPEGAIAKWRRLLGEQGLCLIDEAFQDVMTSPFGTGDHGLAASAGYAECIRLRSVGKFFGLAGIRLGFVLADASRRQQLAAECSPWCVSHPARYVGAQALTDRNWQQSQRQRLWRSSDWLAALFQSYFPNYDWHSAGLFVSARLPVVAAKALYSGMARQGVLLRLRDDGEDAPGLAYIRVGLPPASEQARLERILEQLVCDVA